MVCDGTTNLDLVVVGSGAAGMTAALTAQLRGATVALIDSENLLGGTSAIGGGNLWIPGNSPMRRAGRPDDLAGAFAYLRRVSGSQPAIANAHAFIEHAPRLVDFIEKHTALRFSSIARHDYHASWDGAGFGRSLEPEPFEAARLLGSTTDWFRTNQTRAPLTYSEYRAGPNAELAARRRAQDVRTQGAALIAGLGRAALDVGVRILRGNGLAHLDRAGASGFHVGLTDGGRISAAAVVLASGGFAANPVMRRAFLPSVDFVSLAAGRAVGDGIRSGLDCGAGLSGIGDGWLGAVHVPEDGRVPFLVVRELALPGSMLVNGDGRRFVNEALGYNDVGRGMLAFDPSHGSYPASRSWLIFDTAFRARHAVLGIAPTASIPAGWHQADSIPALAASLMIPPGDLQQSVRLMNEAATPASTIISGAEAMLISGSTVIQTMNRTHVSAPSCWLHSTPSRSFPVYAALRAVSRWTKRRAYSIVVAHR